jgi:hypothetical protein
MTPTHTSATPQARAAFDYINQRNWTIVAVGRDKRPLGEWGVGGRNRYDYRNAEDVLLIDAPGIGVITGPSRLVIIDLDNEDAIRAWHDKFGTPTTRIARTPRGRHLYYEAPQNLYVGPGTEILPGVDVRGGESYAVLPPSTLHGEYAWANDQPIRELPEDVLELIHKAKPERKAKILSGEKFASGSRNDMLASMAGSMRRAGFDHPSISAALHETNKTRCDPPLPTSEVDGIAESICAYDAGTPTPTDHLVALRIEAATREPDEAPVLAERLRSLDTRTLVVDNPPVIDWVWEDYLAPGTLNMLHGEGGLGKSFFALKLAEQIVNHAGGELFGKQLAHGGVVILDGENAESQIHRRIHNTTIASDAPLSVFVVHDPILGYDEQSDLLMQHLADEHNPRLVIIDSQRALWAGDEKEQAEAGVMLRKFARGLEHLPFAVLLLHHDNRGGDFAGSSDINAAISGARIHLQRHRDKDQTQARRMTMPKNRIGPEMPAQEFVLSIDTHPRSLRHEVSGITIAKFESNAEATASDLIDQVLTMIHNQPPTPEEIWAALGWEYADRKPRAQEHRDVWDRLVIMLEHRNYKMTTKAQAGRGDGDGRQRVWVKDH